MMMKSKCPLRLHTVAAPHLRAGLLPHGLDARLSVDDRGTSALELALIAPLLVSLLLGMVHFSSQEVHRMQMTNAVRAGLQYASVRKPVFGENNDLTPINEAVKTAAPAAALVHRTVSSTLYYECSDGSPVDLQDTCSTGHRSAYVEIVMTDTFFPPLSRLVVKAVPLEAKETMRVSGTIRLN
jgi:Flp pilus assembly protein TadG